MAVSTPDVGPAQWIDKWLAPRDGGFEIRAPAVYQSLVRNDPAEFFTAIGAAAVDAARFAALRRRLVAARFYFLPDRGAHAPLPIKAGREFRLPLGKTDRLLDRLAAGILINNEFPSPHDPGEEITIGRWKRFLCWNTPTAGRECGVRLSGMPSELAERWARLQLRWGWRGFGTLAPGRVTDNEDANALLDLADLPPSKKKGAGAVIRVRVPRELTLDVLDEAGRVVWTAR